MTLKLDFNERSDSLPSWLQGFQADSCCLWRYPNKQQAETLIAQKHNTDKDQVFLSNGGDEAIELLFKLCKLNDLALLLPKPAFSQYTHQVGIWGINNSIIAALPDLSIDVEALKTHLSPKQWLVITRPNNPTGECLSTPVLTDLIQVAKKNNANVFLDEAYVEFMDAQSPINYALEYDNVVCLRTFSKAYGLAGARLGYLIGNSELIQQFKKISMPFNVNFVSLQLAQLALCNQPEVRHYCGKIIANRKAVYAFLRSRSIEVYNGQGNFLLFKLKPQIKSLLTSFMQKNGVQIKTELNDLENWVRVTIPENLEQLMWILQAVFKPQIIGFDMDGVLIDTSQSYDACILNTVKALTGVSINTDAIVQLRELGGFNNDWDLTQRLIQKQGKTIDYDKIVECFQNFYQQFKHHEINLLNNDSSLFNPDYVSAIITGRPRDEALDGVKQLGIQPDYIICADDVSEQKPSPMGINWLKSQSQQDCMWFCGDTVDDMQAGSAANCVCIGIGTNCENLYAAGADIVLDNINQLEQLLC